MTVQQLSGGGAVVTGHVDFHWQYGPALPEVQSAVTLIAPQPAGGKSLLGSMAVQQSSDEGGQAPWTRSQIVVSHALGA